MIERSVSFADDVHNLWRTVACGGDNPIVGDQPEKAIAGFLHRSAPFGLDVASADGR